jgi:starch phosphorylase
MRAYKRTGLPITHFDRYNAIHINDTHPTLAIPELMRILVDLEEIDWDTAWGITERSISYTNHTLMREAMEKWPVDLFKTLLPRIYMIVEEIDRRFLKRVRLRYNQVDPNRADAMAIIGEGHVRMAHLSIVGSHSVNGVAKLHSELLAQRELKAFSEFYPNKFNNKTNGITHRRWLLFSNPGLSSLITESIGDGWIKSPEKLEDLMVYHKDAAFLEKLSKAKHSNKIRFANFIKKSQGISIDPDSMFDIQIKRLHEYKRQTLNILHIMSLYLRLKDDPDLDITPRTYFFGAKAAPGYRIAKQTIKLINTVASLINADPKTNEKLKVLFVENYSVSMAELMIPSADISEQISTASKEASGTGNMKLMMNGALTIATLDGANVEILDAVGADNIFLFGLTAEEVYQYYSDRSYLAYNVYQNHPLLKRSIDMMTDGTLNVSTEEFSLIRSALLDHNDAYFVLKDFESYADAQYKAGEAYRDASRWPSMSLINIAKSGRFSSDRTILDYNRDIWHAPVLGSLKGSL